LSRFGGETEYCARQRGCQPPDSIARRLNGESWQPPLGTRHEPAGKMVMRKMRAKAGLNGVVHDHSDLITPLHELGIRYLGNNQWDLPPGAAIRMLAPEDWLVTLSDGQVYRLWSEDELE
jgi:hypothetical protein